MQTLSNTGEHEMIRRLTAGLDNHANLVVGPGDDCAVARLPDGRTDQVFTTDPVVEGVHFNAGENPCRIGHKAVGRVLSDIAAMGAVPQWMLVNVVAPSDLPVATLEAIYVGMKGLCRRFGAVVIGGDLTRGPVLELHVFGTGILPAGTALCRSGACVGDRLLVTGPLGGSAAGRHLDFTPCVAEGIFLRESGLVHAMMDLSDGLGTDLRHLLARSGVGAVLEPDAVPCRGSLEQALYDGEDFELLLAVPEAEVERLSITWNRRFGVPLYGIGSVIDEPEALYCRAADGRRVRLDRKAFEHFSETAGR